MYVCMYAYMYVCMYDYIFYTYNKYKYTLFFININNILGKSAYGWLIYSCLNTLNWNRRMF